MAKLNECNETQEKIAMYAAECHDRAARCEIQRKQKQRENEALLRLAMQRKREMKTEENERNAMKVAEHKDKERYLAKLVRSQRNLTEEQQQGVLKANMSESATQALSNAWKHKTDLNTSDVRFLKCLCDDVTDTASIISILQKPTLAMAVDKLIDIDKKRHRICNVRTKTFPPQSDTAMSNEKRHAPFEKESCSAVVTKKERALMYRERLSEAESSKPSPECSKPTPECSKPKSVHVARSLHIENDDDCFIKEFFKDGKSGPRQEYLGILKVDSDGDIAHGFIVIDGGHSEDVTSKMNALDRHTSETLASHTNQYQASVIPPLTVGPVSQRDGNSEAFRKDKYFPNNVFEMQIVVNNVDGQTSTLNIDSSVAITGIKEKIQVKTEIPHDEQPLIFTPLMKPLGDDVNKMINSDCNIGNY
jgi:hypothetical protein